MDEAEKRAREIVDTAQNLLAMIGEPGGVESVGFCGCGECQHCLLDCAHQSIKDLIAAIREAEERGRREGHVRYCSARGQTFSEMQDSAHASPLYDAGDMILVWVNEGDIIEYGQAIEARGGEG